VTLDGSVTAALLLARLTVNPPLAAEVLKVTRHPSVVPLVKDALVQPNPLRKGTAEPPCAFNCSG
jgi:hypothetical protein